MRSFDPWSTIVTDESGDVVWPRAYYGHSFYQEVPSWIHYGDNGTRRRLLFDGAFIGAEAPSVGAGDSLQMLEVATMMQPYVYAGHHMGAEAPPPPIPGSAGSRRGLLAEVAPHVAPATGPISVKRVFDDRQILHVEICVDGKCYRTSMDLAPILMMLMEKLARWHRAQHDGMEQLPATTAVVGAMEGAVGAAADTMADIMICHHVNVMTGGFFDGMGSSIGETLRDLAPVISTVATSVAAYYGGPEAGAAAAKLAPVVTDLQANLLDPKGASQQRAVAQQSLQRVNQVAQSDPRAAQALAAAHQAVRDTAIAYHVKGTVDKAITGDPAARQDVGAVVQAAERGDPAAKSTYEVIAQVLLDKAQHSAWGQQLWERVMGNRSATVSGEWYLPPVIVGSFWDSVKDALYTVTLTKSTNEFIKDNHLEPYVQAAATAVATYYGGPAAGAGAGALAPMVMNLGLDDKNKAQAAAKDIQGVKATAQQQSPQLAQAVDAAHGAIEHTATAYQVAQLAKDSAAGVPAAQQALSNLQRAAARGDQNAVKALQAVTQINREQLRQRSAGSFFR